MDTSAFHKKNGRYYLKYYGSDSYYKNGLLLECIEHFKYLFKGKLLDLGCGNKPYSDIYNEICESSVGCDVPFSLHRKANVEVLCYAEDTDKHFDSEYFDTVLCTEVLEHTVNDRAVILNINKILKHNGNLIISAPYTYVTHEAPHDYRRYTYYGLKDILEKNGFEVKSVFSMGASFSSFFFIFYYTLKKIFFYSLKSVGFENINENNFINAIISIPELLLFKLYIPFFRQKLETSKPLSVNELYSSLGYFFVAKKITNL
ncbi:MAG TPA: methyltransferase domain-containing protein [Ignavibacteria bacterium]|nr:methyltransferase domain-containing protein [Ignavibacteria bacterium]